MPRQNPVTQGVGRRFLCRLGLAAGAGGGAISGWIQGSGVRGINTQDGGLVDEKPRGARSEGRDLGDAAAVNRSRLPVTESTSKSKSAALRRLTFKSLMSTSEMRAALDWGRRPLLPYSRL